MQLQRIQSLWLLVAVVCCAVSLFLPWLNVGPEVALTPLKDVFLGVLVGLSGLLPLIGIFSFRSLRRQKQICAISALMSVFALGYVLAQSLMNSEAEASLAPVGPMMVAAGALFDLLARRAISAD